MKPFRAMFELTVGLSLTDPEASSSQGVPERSQAGSQAAGNSTLGLLY